MSIHGLMRMARRTRKRKKNPEPSPKRRLGDGKPKNVSVALGNFKTTT